ncbi:hypothetical protein HDV04_003432 [Boothiomyces sp. JEL0838]|nr:hypothetical protein HDV04_003432 [Boothiomyces sp. JEL0838]
MSASSPLRHKPLSAKRTLGLPIPEFPPLPLYFLDKVQQFAVKSQKALEAIGNFTTQNYVILPLLSANDLQDQFRVHENSVYVIMRKAYSNLKDAFWGTTIHHNIGTLFRGPTGVGKSYLLYLLAAEHRLYRQTYRVTYVNDCAAWKKEVYGYILRELVVTFYDDIIEQRSIVEWCESNYVNEKERDMWNLIDMLTNFVLEKDLTWILIFDQYNAFYDQPVTVDDFPFTIVCYLAAIRYKNIKVIASESVENDRYPLKMRGWKPHDISSYNFDCHEYSFWCEQYLLSDQVQVDPKSEEALDALFWSGGVPFELYLLWRQPGKDLIRKTMFYREFRYNEFLQRHGKFKCKINDYHAVNCVSKMLLGLSPPKILVGMDPQLLERVMVKKIIAAINPVARRALLDFYGERLVKPLEEVANHEICGVRSANKERILRNYLTTSLELVFVFSFKFRKSKLLGYSKDIPEERRIELDRVEHFFNHGPPPKEYIDISKTTLFIPESPISEGSDFIIWDAKLERVMVFQLAISNYLTKGSMNNDKNFIKEWKKLNTSNQFEIFWIVPKAFVGETIQKADVSLIFIEDMAQDFPAFTHVLRLRNQ